MPAVTNLTGYSPNIKIHQAVTAKFTGTFDSIQVVSGDSSNSVEIDVTPLGHAETTVDVSSGDTLYGPFTAYKINATFPTGGTVIVHERSKLS